MSSAAPSITRERILVAVSWTTLATGASALIGFARSVVLARLLAPEDYGVFGLSAMLIAAVGAVTNLNLTSSLMVRDLAGSERRRIIDTAWTFELGRQILVTLLILAAAYPFALYAGDRRVFAILLITAFVPCVMGLSNIGMELLRKEIDFRKIAFHRLVSEAITTAIVLLIAYRMRNAFALAMGQLAGAAISVAVSYRLHPYRPKPAFDRAVIRSAVHFSASLFIIGLFTFVTTQFDNFVVAHYLGAAVLGIYLLAYRLISFPVDMLSEVLGAVMFPAFAGMKATRSEHSIARALAMVTLISVATLAAVLFAMRILRAELIHVLYGPKWEAAVPILEVLVLVGLFRGATRAISPFLLGTGRADFDAKAKAIETAIYVPLTIYLVQQSGAIGAAVAGAATYAIAFAIRLAAACWLLPNAAGLLLRVLASVFFVIILSLGGASAVIASTRSPLASAIALVVLIAAGSFLVYRGFLAQAAAEL